MLCSTLPRDKRAGLSRGFTLTELLVVVAVIILLVGLLLPGMSALRKKAREAGTRSLMGVVEQAALSFRTDRGRVPGHYAPSDIASEANNTDLLTEGENMVLDLAGGIVANSTSGGPEQGIFTIRMRGEDHKLALGAIGDPQGPGYLDLGRVRQVEHSDGSYEYRGSDLFRPIADDFRTTNTTDDADNPTNDVVRPIPVVHDYFGAPMMVWVRNPLAGGKADFVDVHSDLVQDNSAVPRRAKYYWWSNSGILGSESQHDKSVLGADLSSLNNSNGGIRKRMVPSLWAVLGHPAFNEPQNANAPGDGRRKPTVGLGEFVLQSAGADRVFLAHGGQNIDESTGEASGVFEAFYAGNKIQPNEHQRPMNDFDDLVHAGG